MDQLIKSGRYLFAIAIAAFGIRISGPRTVSREGCHPLPPWTPYGSVLAYPLGVFLIVAAGSIATGVRARLVRPVDWYTVFSDARCFCTRCT